MRQCIYKVYTEIKEVLEERTLRRVQSQMKEEQKA